MSEQPATDLTRVLIVDDNTGYREAFRRNLLLQGYEVAEAGDMDEALRTLGEQPVDVVVTDLSMRRPTEGLDLIRQARSLNPHLPIIMISAVGTFEEGAEASRLGARTVISKSRIDEEMENLFRAIDQACEEGRRSRELAETVAELRAQGEADPARAMEGLRKLLGDAQTPATVRGEAYDVLSALGTAELAQASRRDLDRAAAEGPAPRERFEQVDKTLVESIAIYNELEHHSREALRTAEFLYQHGEAIGAAVDFSRSIGFSYCFAVENEAKHRLRKRLQKFFGEPATGGIIHSLL